MSTLTKIAFAGALLLASSGSMAGGCLQGTWTYYDDDGAVVGYQTVGCGADDGTTGEVTANKTFSQGCGGVVAG